jgi:hypothetical protein
MPNENEKPTRNQAEQQKAARHPTRHSFPAVQEKETGGARDAHTVVANEVGNTVLWTNFSVRNGRYREM